MSPPPPPPSDDITTTPTSTTFLTIVKLGGRSITDKSTYETLDKTALEKCSILLQNAISKKTKKNENERVIVIHGAGSFGHMSAKRCGLGDEDRKLKMTSSLFLDGCEETRRSVQKLNELVCESLEEERENKVKVECVRRHLGDAWRFNEKGEVDVLGYASVKEYCEAHCFSTSPTSSSSSKSLLLLLHGDVVEDATHGRSILSGDRIALEIAKAYALNKTRDQRVVIRVVFITGARGVFSRDPDGVDADCERVFARAEMIEYEIDLDRHRLLNCRSWERLWGEEERDDSANARCICPPRSTLCSARKQDANVSGPRRLRGSACPDIYGLPGLDHARAQCWPLARAMSAVRWRETVLS